LAQSGVHKGIADADSCQTHRTRDHRGAASGILSDRERECAQRCILQTELPTKALAQKYLLTNWPVIEKMARDALAAGNLEDGQIKLVMRLSGSLRTPVLELQEQLC
jgi:hypothetical protein